jgi:hypothetical protein
MATRAPAVVSDETAANLLRAAGVEVIGEVLDTGKALQGFTTTIVRALASG